MDGICEPELADNTAFQDSDHLVSNLRVRTIQELQTPQSLLDAIPISKEQARFVSQKRKELKDIIEGNSGKFLVIIGPCSIHDPSAALEYATRLSALSKIYKETLLIVMRVYFEKPRTTVGWKGLVYDPFLDNSCRITEGLEIARRLMHDITNLNVAIGCEFLDTITPQYFSDFVTWGAIGARTTESQIHRQLASGLSMPVGFKNGTGGSVKVAVDAILAAENEHTFCGTNEQGRCSVVNTLGNKYCHLVLRGSLMAINYDKQSIESAYGLLQASGKTAPILIDCSHDNSGKDYRNQKHVLADILESCKDGETRKKILGVMIESNLVEGKQEIGRQMVYGKSVTDGCIGWIETVELIKRIHHTFSKCWQFA